MPKESSPLLFATPPDAGRRRRRDAAPRAAPRPVPDTEGRSAPARRARAAEALGIEVGRRIERLIGDGTLRPGERINEVALSRGLGVSRGPVREAVRALERSGLVTVIMNRGAFVRSLGLDDAREIYEINGVLFGLAAGHAAGTLAESQGLALRGLVEAMDVAIARNRRDEFFRLNSAFHALVMACGRNAEAQTLYAQLTRKLMLLRRRSFEQPGHMQDANREHLGLMEAILAGEGGRARELAERHARHGHERFLDAIRHQADVPATEEEPR